MPNAWVTSDIHFGHRRIMEFCPKTRPYSSVSEMDEAIIADWNSKVQPEDTIYNLGDFFFHRDTKTVLDIVARLNGNIHWILGNHDYPGTVQAIRSSAGNRVKVDHYLELKNIGETKSTVIMLHYPMFEWNKSHHGSIHLHGHCHGNINHLNEGIRRIDVGWDSLGKIERLDRVVDALALHVPVKKRVRNENL